MTMVKISDCFHYIINLLRYVMKLAGMICKLDRFLENLQIVQYKLARLADWTEHIYVCVRTFVRQCVSQLRYVHTCN